jgi:hypothetical protein
VESTIVVSAFTDTVSELIPRTSRGRRKGLHELAVDNRGNVDLRLSFEAFDPDDALRLEIDPLEVSAAPGIATFVKVRPRPRRSFWHGSPKTHQFQVVVQDDRGQQALVPGSHLQEPLIPKWLPKAAGALMALLLLLFFIAYQMVTSKAKDVAIEAAKEAVAEATPPPVPPAPPVPPPTVSGEGGEKAPEKTPETTPPTATPVKETNFRTRLEAAVPAGQGKPSVDKVMESDVTITDIVIQNSNADAGELLIWAGPEMLFKIQLDAVRTYDLHNVSPIDVPKGTTLSIEVQCRNLPVATPATRPSAAGSASPAAALAAPPPCAPGVTFLGIARS